MSSTVKARTARKPHLCGTCQWSPSADATPAIAPGHRYLLRVRFPDVIDGPDDLTAEKECVRCATDRDEMAPHFELGACASYCHGVTPCALPFRHTGDHECRQCLIETAVAA